MNDLTFDEAKHEYRVDGRVVPSVTQVLSEMGFINSEWFTEESRIRGTLVHRLCELWDKDELDPLTVDPRLAGYLKAWQKFCRAEEMVWLHIEKKMFHKVLRYAGTPDRIGFDRRGWVTVVDIKTGISAPWHSYQLGGYLSIHPAKVALSVLVADDGTFRVEYHQVEQAVRDWNAIYHTYTLQKGLAR